MNRYVIAALALASWLFSFCLFAFVPGCGNSSPGDNVTCGPGTTLEAGTCYANETDASMPVRKREGGAADSGREAAVAVGPAFAGVTSVAPASLTALQITWSPAKDPTTPPSLITYRVYVATASGKENFAVPQSTTPPGATSVVIDTLQANATYFVVVRAVDAAKVEDKNTSEKSAKTQLDEVAPTFAGAKSAASAPQGSIVLAWAPAKDNLTPAPGMSYLVYLATTAGEEDLSSPDFVSDFGATSITITGLPASLLANGVAADAHSTYFAIVRAMDAAGNIDSNKKEVSAKAGPVTLPPVFAGCTAAVAKDATSVTVTWDPATDSTTPPSEMAYDVYTAKKPGGEDFTTPAATFTGVTSGLVMGLAQSTKYYFVCRARDATGNEDANTSERFATTTIDRTPPVFAGVTSITDVTTSSLQLNWSPASDIETPIVYLVYEATSMGGEDFLAAPTLTTVASATSAVLTNLTSATTYYFVVRAEDAADNIDGNTAELSAATGVSFVADVAPIFAQNCALTGCHIGSAPPEGQTLAPATVAYLNIVNVSTEECPEPPDASLPPACGRPYLRVSSDTIPTDSYLWLKINGLAPVGSPVMPPNTSTYPPLMAPDIATIQAWLIEGAPNN
jgi:hypothetical protein